ncbi:MAG: dGTP triphosphohydrolase [Opitutales bacterium]
MADPLYRDADVATYGEGRTVRADDPRNPFSVDRDRLVFSQAFRRLQSKTQVFQAGEYDFYRTRLTHSIEVAKIGRSLCVAFGKQKDSPLVPGQAIDAGLVEAACLAHDLGHPPFGHIGERKLNALMADHGGFEGNAQTVRILTGLFYRRPADAVGMNPTRALLDGVMKYKALFGELAAEERRPPDNHFLYDDQAPTRAWVHEGESDLPSDATAWNQRKSIECQIMDWADDTAYSLNDLADGIQAGYLTLERLEQWAARRDKALSGPQRTAFERLLSAIRKDSYEPFLAGRIGDFIENCRLVLDPSVDEALPLRRRLALAVPEEIRSVCDCYKAIAVDLIFRSPQIQQIEFKGGFILERLFQAVAEHYLDSNHGLTLLPDTESRWIRSEPNTAGRARRICDYLAGLTDGEALRMYKRLFNPDYGSITDLQR